VSRLEDALRQEKTEYTRDAALQRFEFTFELLWKAMKANSDSAGLPVYSPRDSLRSAFQLGLVEDRPEWFSMLEDRNVASHTYSEATGEAIFSRLPSYVPLILGALDHMRDDEGRG
jgi:nucleotidyltransferase substrate binding protein (TIGR01987 family)